MIWKRCAKTWLVVGVTLQGCATVMPATVPLPRLPSSEDRASIRRIAVVVGGQLPGITELHIPTAGEAAAMSAGRAMSDWMSDPGSGCIGLACLPCVGAIGAAAGAAQAQNPADVQAFQDYLEATRRQMPKAITELVRRGTVERTSIGEATIVRTPDMKALAVDGFDAVLEVQVGLTVSGEKEINPLTSFHLSVEPRLRRIPGGELLHADHYTCDTESRKFSEWTKAGLALLRSRVERSQARLSEKAVDEVFLVQPITPSAPQPAGWKPARPPVDGSPELKWQGGDSLRAMQIGLRALYPPTTGPWFRGKKLLWTTTGSTRPTFRWEPFPPAGATDSLEAALGGRIADVSYEILIAEAAGELPGELVEHRTGLGANECALERPLASGRGYFWTVRARYVLDGMPQVTEWGCTHPLGRLMAEVPNVYSYRFKARGR